MLHRRPGGEFLNAHRSNLVQLTVVRGDSGIEGRCVTTIPSSSPIEHGYATTGGPCALVVDGEVTLTTDWYEVMGPDGSTVVCRS